MTKYSHFFIFIVLIVLSFPFSSPMAYPTQSVIQQLNTLYEHHRFTFFCEQPFDAAGRLVLPRCKTCPTTPLSIRWIPLVPLARLAATLPCYHQKLCSDKTGRAYRGQRCCQKQNPRFLKIVADLHNYVPDNPILFQLKKNYTFFDDGSPTPSIGCPFYVDHSRKKISPAPHTRGFIARTYLYFHQHYQLPLTEEEKTLFTHWNAVYPSSPWEKEREQRIYAVRKN